MNIPSSWRSERIPELLDNHEKSIREILTFANRIVKRGFICNTLGNIAVKIFDDRLPNGEGILTKRKGVSLEELDREDLIVTDLRKKVLYAGEIPPSGGHFLNQKIFLSNNSDSVIAVIHTHPDSLIGYMSQQTSNKFPYVSVDTALILGQEPKIFDYGVNPEADIALVAEEDLRSSALIMPNHGLTTLGSTLSEAYHRHTSVVSECNRLLIASTISFQQNEVIRTVPAEEVEALYKLSSKFIYNKST